MIFVILALGILMVVCGTILYSKFEPGKDSIGAAFQIIGVIVIISSIIAFVSLLKCVLDRVGIDKKIAMYETENTKIEQQIVDVINQYQGRETSLQRSLPNPELKSVTLVQSQIEVYNENNKAIKELKNMAINASFYRWWLYFGK